jgi:hypothetical protein
MATEPKKQNPKKQAIQMVCGAIGLVVALAAMFALGISGALPGALFGALGGGAGGLIGWAIASVVVQEP